MIRFLSKSRMACTNSSKRWFSEQVMIQTKRSSLSFDQSKSTGYVLIDAGDQTLDNELKLRLNNLRKKMDPPKDRNELTKFLHNVQVSKEYYRDLRAVASGDVPDQQILRVRMILFRKIRYMLKNYCNQQEISQVGKKKLAWLIHKAFEGACHEVIFAGIVPGPYMFRSSSAIQQLLIVYRSKPDLHSLEITQAQDFIPSFAIEWAKAIDINGVKKSFARNRWDMLKQWVLQDKLEIISSDEWNELHSNVLSKLHYSFFLMKVIIEQLIMLSLAEDLKKAKEKRHRFEYSSLVCLNYVKKSLETLQPKHHSLIVKTDKLISLLNEGMRKHRAEVVKLHILQLADDLEKLYDNIEKEKWGEEVDAHLEHWADKTYFENNLEDKNWKSLSNRITNFISTETPEKVEICKSSITDQLLSCGEMKLSGEQLRTVTDFQTKYGYPISQIKPHNILLISPFGSQLYNLATPQSDTDYFVIFRRPLSVKNEMTIEDEHQYTDDVHGHEFKVIEARMFCHMLYKSSPMMCELIFANTSTVYNHPAMQILMDNYHILMCERMIGSFKRYAQHYMRRVRLGLQEKRLAKHFYQIFHKVLTVEEMTSGKKPSIRISGKDKDYLMHIRSGDIFNDKSVIELYSEAETRINSAMEKRLIHLPEYPKHSALRAWLAMIRNTAH